MSFPRYAEYVDSGVSWIGHFPEHWKVGLLKKLALLRNGFPFNSEHFTETESEGDRLIRIRDILDKSGKTFTTEGCPPGAFVDNGDLLIGMDGDFNFTLWSQGKAKLNQRVCAIKAASVHLQKYIYYSLASPLKIINELTYSTTVKHLSSDQVLKIKLPVPTPSEIRKIVTFLDHETAKIDALIAEQKRLIKLLQEKRQAVISHAVTKGLDPNVPMKDSGVEWLGEVPAHWVVTPIKYLVSTPVTDGPHETPQFLEAGVTFISAEAVSKGKIEFSKAKYISEEDHLRYSRKYKPKKFDIFMVKSGATTGVVAINESDDDFNIWSPLAVIRCNESANPYFVMHAMRSRSFQESVVLNWNFGTQQNIGMRVIENLVVALPPVGEQSDIALKLNQRIESFDVLEQDAVNMVGLLTERRSALISAAVTGKIDVRDWQPPADENAFDEEVQKAGLEASA